MSAGFTLDELFLLGLLAGYTPHEVGQMMLEADDVKREKVQLHRSTVSDARTVCAEAPVSELEKP